MSGTLSGRSSPDLGWGRKKFEVPVGTVFVLDRALSVLMLDVDPGEGYEVLMPANGRLEDATTRVAQTEEKQ